MPDQRWKHRIIGPTLWLQLAFSAVLIGVSAPKADTWTYSYYSSYYGYWDVGFFPVLIVACLSVVSSITHLGCFYGGSLHPLVVLTLAIEWLITWLGLSIFIIIWYSVVLHPDYCRSVDLDQFDSYTYASRYMDDSDFDAGALRSVRTEKCHKGTSTMVFSILML